MKNSIGLYFQLEIKEGKQALSLVRQSLKKIEQLEDAGISVEYLELRAKEFPHYGSDKEIWLKIDSNKGTYIASETSDNWDDAFKNPLRTVEERMLYEEADYTRHAALVEITIPLGEYACSRRNRVSEKVLA
jgi:hypothetical protein